MHPRDSWEVDVRRREVCRGIGRCVVYYGRVSRIEAIELISRADFTMLLRKNKRYAQAGFHEIGGKPFSGSADHH